jgi:hypothetical protein
MDAGPASVRNRFTAITQTFKGSMVLTGSQLTTFNTFFRTTIKHGSLSFTWIHPQTDASATVRFKTGKKPEWQCVKPAPAPNDRIYLASLEIEVQP